MNEITYRKMIASEFGGLRRDELLIKLERLCELVKRARGGYKRNNEEKPVYIAPIKKPELSNEQIINKILTNYGTNNVSNYVKAEKIITRVNRSEWIPIKLIPSWLWVDFFNFAEYRHEVIFDSERHDQYFKVI